MTERVIITGAYRSGTTLLSRLLDGHPRALNLPVENCLIRDMLFHMHLAHPELRYMGELDRARLSGDIGAVVDVVCRHPKTGEPLSTRLSLRGGFGNQDVELDFDPGRFRERFAELLAERQEAGWGPEALFDAYERAYFAGLGRTMKADTVIVSKCPEAGWCIGFYLEHFPDARVIHVLRDPRAVLASHKAELERSQFLWAPRLRLQARIVNDAFRAAREWGEDPRVLVVRYEDLVKDLAATMNHIADFAALDFDPSLLHPTVMGRAWKSNSSFHEARERSSVGSEGLERFRRKLNDLELAYIEDLCAESLGQEAYPAAGGSGWGLGKRALYETRHALGLPRRIVNRLRRTR